MPTLYEHDISAKAKMHRRRSRTSECRRLPAAVLAHIALLSMTGLHSILAAIYAGELVEHYTLLKIFGDEDYIFR